jgi:hypothetical protein
MYGRRDAEGPVVSDMFEDGEDKSLRCHYLFETCRDMFEGEGDKLDRPLQQQRAGQDQLQTSHNKYVACPDQNDRCPGKQRAVPGKTGT